MSESNAPSRAVTIGGGIVATAIVAVSVTLNWRDFTYVDIALTVAASVAMCFVALYALPIRGLRMRRNGLNAEAVFLDLSVATPLVALGGAVGITAAAVVFLIGYAAAAIIARTHTVTDLARHGVLRALFVLAFLPFIAGFTFVRDVPVAMGSIVWGAILALAFALYITAVSSPISAYTYHISLARIWERVLRDPRTWIVGGGNVVWAVVVRDTILSGHYFAAI
ncbi:MAG TPA: hypothetical protein VNF68_15015, partial [Candidatus Baltobacteraceae bacterium]|nr:hypothetical protein [Candidatus Baltobacteraceae bacterium]